MNYVVIFAIVKSMRKISPFIATVLMMLMLSGSLGYTLIRHNCLHCGTEEIIAMLAGNDNDDICCCTHEATDGLHHHSNGEMVFSDDCCTHESERIVTDELVISKLQNEIIPYFAAATVVGIIPDLTEQISPTIFHLNPFHSGCDLTTMHCQIKS